MNIHSKKTKFNIFNLIITGNNFVRTQESANPLLPTAQRRFPHKQNRW